MIETFIQIGIAALGAAGIMLGSSKRVVVQRTGYALGLAAQPLWFHTTLANQQWGMAFLTVCYTYAWLTGLVRAHRRLRPKTADGIRGGPLPTEPGAGSETTSADAIGGFVGSDGPAAERRPNHGSGISRLPWDPESPAALKRRYSEAVVTEVDAQSAKTSPPALQRRHVFDFENGMRLIITRGRCLQHCSRTHVYVTAGIEDGELFGASRHGYLEPPEFIGLAIGRYAELSGGRRLRFVSCTTRCAQFIENE